MKHVSLSFVRRKPHRITKFLVSLSLSVVATSGLALLSSSPAFGQTSNTVTTTVPVGNNPFGVAYDSANNDIYVANEYSSDVSVIDGSTNTVIATVPVGGPRAVAYDSANHDIYVTNEIFNNISVIDGSTNTVIATVPVGDNPYAVTYDSANNDIYVANEYSSDVSIIDGSTNTVIATVPVGRYPDGVAYDSANNDIYVTNKIFNDILIISGSTNTVIAAIPIGFATVGVAYDSANNDIYVAILGLNYVSVINGSINTVIATVAVGNGPTGVAYDSANNDVYVSNSGSGDVSVINSQVDNDLAITAPTNLTVNATSSSGAIVNYSLPVVSDPDDATLPVATCSQPSGSVFPVGVTTVNCSVTDSEDTPSTVTTSFTIDVLGAKSQLQSLGSSVVGVGPGGSLSSKIQLALSNLNSGNLNGAKSILQGFINEVHAQSGKKISKARASALIADAQRIINVIG
ncbi:MAG: YncE family protein [Actinomycetota bacterium]|nr:MAG: YncE family protein [Actinomycetota bacterium]